MSDFRQTGPFSRQAAANVEAVPGQIWGLLQGVGRKLGRAGQYLSSEKAARDYTNLLSGQLPQIGRPAVAEPNRDMESADIPIWDPVAKKYIYDATKQVPIVSGLDGAGNVDRRKSDTYKQYAQTPEGQFERYFKTPEFDYVFGAASRGKGAPADVGQMEALAGQLTAPQDVPLSAYYRAQSAAGRANMPEITQELGYAEGSALAKWAAANPMLAKRLYDKAKAKNAMEPPMAEFGARASSPEGYAGTFREQPGLFGTVSNPVVPTENTDETGLTQGERVDLGRGVQDLQYWQKMKTQGYQAPFKADNQGFF